VHLGRRARLSNAVESGKRGDRREYVPDVFVESADVGAPKVDPKQAERMKDFRAKLDWALVIHTSYLVNVCKQGEAIREKSAEAFRGEIERALTFGRKYLVLHPGSWNGLTREEGP